MRLLLIILAFPVPLCTGLYTLPWRWIGDEYKQWFKAIKICIATIYTRKNNVCKKD